MHPLLLHSGSRLAAMIRSGEVSSLEVVDAHIEHIQNVNGRLNAVVAQRFAKAREEARFADELVAHGDVGRLPPFHGVPCTIKECFAVVGMPNTSGLVARKSVIVDRDATTVTRLKQAGCIVLGVTNVSELCMWMETTNRVYGRTNNPYDVRRIVGGSSGGEGAIVGAGGAPFGLGADIGGSIRMPAFFNGVFGHKPTGGMVPGTGQYPLAENAALRYLTTGPIARRAEDLFPLLGVLAGPDQIDTGCVPFELGDPSSVEVRSLHVVNVEDDGFTPVSKEMRTAQRRALMHFDDLGCEIRTVKPKLLRHGLEIWSAMLAEASQTPFSVLLGGGRPIDTVDQLKRFAKGTSPHTLAAIGLAIVERLPAMLGSRAERMIELGRELREELVSLIGPHGIMLYPSNPTTAPYHLVPLLPPFRWVYTCIINVMELPSTQVPLGLDSKGLPLGVQVIATHGNDHVSIAAALELERAFGGWVPPEN